jgi:hypothetical protein
MPETPTLSIEQLVQSFQDLSLPLSEWTHEAHLRAGLWHVYHYSLDEATCLLRAGIIIYNHAQGGKNTPNSGYHETITLFWISVLDHFVKTFPAGNSLPFIENQFLQSKWASKNLPFLYFSRERLFSVKARSRWIEPDLQPLNV